MGWGKQTVFNGENKLFSSKNVSISRKRSRYVENILICPKLLLMNNRKLHMCFQLAPRLMILNCYKLEFSENFAGVRIFGRQQLLKE